MTEDPLDPFGATRLSHVDPETGLEAPARPADHDATVIGAPGSSPSAPRRTAEFVPTIGARSTEEITAAWSGGADRPGLDRPLRAILLALRRLRPPRRALRVAPLACAALLASALVALAAGRPAAPRDAPARAAAPSDLADAAPVAAITAPPPGPAAKGEEPVRLVHLVDALGEGRLEEARGICAALGAAAPDDEALRAALEILDRARRGGPP